MRLYKLTSFEREDINNNLIAIKGSVPGKKNTTVFIKDSVKVKK